MSTHPREEIELELMMLRCRRGDRSAFESLIRKYERPLFYFIRRIVLSESDAWDALQKTWLRLFQNPPQEGSGQSLKAWSYRVARNAALNHLRDEGIHSSTVLDESACDAVEQESVEFDVFDLEDVHRALDELARPDREVLTLHFLEDLSTQEVAEVLEIPRGTVKWRLHVAKKNLRQRLEKS